MDIHFLVEIDFFASELLTFCLKSYIYDIYDKEAQPFGSLKREPKAPYEVNRQKIVK